MDTFNLTDLLYYYHDLNTWHVNWGRGTVYGRLLWQVTVVELDSLIMFYICLSEEENSGPGETVLEQ